MKYTHCSEKIKFLQLFAYALHANSPYLLFFGGETVFYGFEICLGSAPATKVAD
jgi:hypothetical protein